ncbi:MAG: RND family transporter [Wujia sp.]
MQKLSEKIVKYRVAILIVAVILLIPSAIGFLNTRVNYDILYYLPDDIETMEGQDILMDEFGKGAYGLFVCNGLSTKDTIKLADKIDEIDHVAEVISFDSLTNGLVPEEMLPEKVRNIFYSKNGDGCLMFIFFDTTSSADETMDAIEEIQKVAGKTCFLSSMAVTCLDTKNLVENEMFIYTAIAVILTMLVLFLTTDSFMIPVVFMVSIGAAIIYNLGSNVIRGEISYITMALVAILQLGVTMDYSIFLYHSYLEACKYEEDHKTAMAKAITATITSVTASSLTTIAGFLSMCFMTFTLGLDMGIVMAKGVVIGVICCVTVLPALILTFDKVIAKTKHKDLEIPTAGISKLVTKNYIVVAILLLLLWVPAIYGYSNMDVYYKLDESIPEDLPSRTANAALAEDYDLASVSMLLVPADMKSKDVKAMLNDINNLEGIEFAIGLDSVIGSAIPQEALPESITSSLETENWKLLLVSSAYEVATDEVNAQCREINEIVKDYNEDILVIGEAPATKDLVEITDKDFTTVSIVSIGAIFVLILIATRSVTLPIILVLVIELAIYINEACAFFTGTTLPFIASVCVGTIQLGATVDYAILMTNRYKQERILGRSKAEAVRTAVDISLNSIFTSALGFFAATIGVAVYSDVDLIGSICMLLARGAIISMIIVNLLLPALFMIFDGLILRTTRGMRICIEQDRRRLEE